MDGDSEHAVLIDAEMASVLGSSRRRSGRRTRRGRPDVENSASEEWLKKNRKSPWAGKKEGLQAELTEEQKKYAEEYAEKKAEKERGGGGGEKADVADEHFPWEGGTQLLRAVLDCATNDHCYIPKRWVRPHKGCLCNPVLSQAWPSSPVNRHAWILRLRSRMSSILASVWELIWAIQRQFEISPFPMMHGTEFLSASVDKSIKYWDTETGKAISTFSTGKIPYVVKLNPDDDKQNILLAEMSVKKIVQWDMTTGEITRA